MLPMSEDATTEQVIEKAKAMNGGTGITGGDQCDMEKSLEAICTIVCFW